MSRDPAVCVREAQVVTVARVLSSNPDAAGLEPSTEIHLRFRANSIQRPSFLLASIKL